MQNFPKFLPLGITCELYWDFKNNNNNQTDQVGTRNKLFPLGQFFFFFLIFYCTWSILKKFIYEQEINKLISPFLTLSDTELSSQFASCLPVQRDKDTC